MPRARRQEAGVINYITYHRNSSKPHFPLNEEDLISYKDHIIQKNLSRDTFKQYIRHIKKQHIRVVGLWEHKKFDPIISDGLNKLRDESRSIGNVQGTISPTQSIQQPASLLSGQLSVNDIQGTLQSDQGPYAHMMQQQISLQNLPNTVQSQLGQISGQVSFQDSSGTASTTHSVSSQSSQDFVDAFLVEPVGLWNHKEFDPIISDDLNKLRDKSTSTGTSSLIDQPSINDVQDTVSSTQSVQQPTSLLSGELSISDIQGTLQSDQGPYVHMMQQQISLQNLPNTVQSQLSQISGQISFQDSSSTASTTHTIPSQPSQDLVDKYNTFLTEKMRFQVEHIQELRNILNQKVQQTNNRFNQEIQQLLNNRNQEIQRLINQEVQELNNRINQEFQELEMTFGWPNKF